MKKLIALIEVRKIIALAFSALFIYMAASGKIQSDQSLTVILMVISYYFGKSTALDTPKGEKHDGP